MEFIVDVNVVGVVVVVVVGQAGRHFETKRQKFESFLELRSLRLKAKVKTDVELEKSFGNKIGLETQLIILKM